MRFPPEWRALGVLGIAVLLYLYFRPLLTLLFLFFIALLLAAVLHPVATWLHERAHLPRAALAISLALVVVGGTAAVVVWGVPVLLTQASELVESIPALHRRAEEVLLGLARRNPAWAEYTRRQLGEVAVERYAANLLAWVGAAGLALVQVLAATILILVVALYSLVRPLPLVSGLLLLWPESRRERIGRSVNAGLGKVRRWIGGQLVAMAAVGLTVGLSLSLLGVPYAALFAVLAGLLEIVPTLGPLLSALPPMAVAFAQEPIRALWVALVFFGVQQVENHLLVPLVMAGALRMHPVLLLFTTLAMGTLFGLLGVFIALPLAAVAQAVYQELHPPETRQSVQAERDAAAALRMPVPRPGEGA
ncbi:MAG: AI-2E family transporter [Armatimonadetes bacterium]|nr:AI-2E family transporter [Armatimonadota bacterium]